MAGRRGGTLRRLAPGERRVTTECWPADVELIRACRSGDDKAWEKLILRYQRLVYSVPVAYRLPPADADEIFQRVSVKLFENLDRLRRTESLAPWLVVTARRECQAFLREARRAAPLENGSAAGSAEDPADVVRDLHRIECAHSLALALERLGHPCRALLHALYMEDPAPPYEEIARRLGRPVGSLGPTRMRCLEKLRKLYFRLGGREP